MVDQITIIKTTVGKEYKLIDGTCYPVNTPDEIILICENARKKGIRLRFDFGDRETGRSWNEVNDITGYIGRSTGSYKIPILVFNRRSLGGGSLLTDCVVKISLSSGGRVLYQHPTYHKDPA